jgi:integrase
MPYGDLPEFMTRLRALASTDRKRWSGFSEGTAARCLEFIILTAARTGEASGARWDEINGDIWTVPGERMKEGTEHRVPLSAPALAVLAHMRKSRNGGAMVFSGAHKIFARGVLKKLGCTSTVHGFRSTFRDWAAETTSFPSEVCETALSHAVLSQTVRAYLRSDLLEARRDLMEAWGRYCAGKTATVLPIRKSHIRVIRKSRHG